MTRKIKNPEDPRVIRTRLALRRALIELIPEKGFDSITLQDITNRAGLNRTTFYLHYRDKTDLLTASLREAYEDLVGQAMPTDAAFATLRDAPGPIVATFTYIGENADFFQVILNEESVPMISAGLRQYIDEVVLAWLEVLGAENARVDVGLAVKFIGSAFLGVVRWWLENDQPYTPEYMARQLRALITDGIDQALG
ncbi:MAG: TetR/AcrR family transcriptional regulator [Anaerolineae bacterium]